MVKVLVVIGILALLAFVAFGQYVGVRNTLVTKNEAVKAAWSQVDIVLQRRADLIPNLVETVKGFAQQEQTVFGDIAKARAALLRPALAAAEDCGQQATRWRARPAAGGRGELSATAIQRKLPAPAGRTGGHRKPHRRRRSATTTRCRTTTPTSRLSATTSSPAGPASSPTTLTSPPVRGVAPGAHGEFHAGGSTNRTNRNCATPGRAAARSLAWKLISQSNLGG